MHTIRFRYKPHSICLIHYNMPYFSCMFIDKLKSNITKFMNIYLFNFINY